MTVTLYNNKSAVNVLNKNIKTVQNNITATAKGPVDVDRPSLLLDYASADFNYFYVSDWGRYYFVTSRSLIPGEHIIITGESDPLQSFLDSVSALPVFIVRSSDTSLRNSVIADPLIPIESDCQYTWLKGSEIMAGENYIIGVC